MTDERSVADIQREIELARATLAGAVDELAYRLNPQRVRTNLQQTLRAKVQSSQGRAVIAGAGALLLLLVVRRVRRH